MSRARIHPKRHQALRVTRLRMAGAFVAWWLAAFIVLSNIWITTNFGQLELPQFVYHVVNLAEVIKPMPLGFVILSAVLIFGLPTALATMAVWFMRRLAKFRDAGVTYLFWEKPQGLVRAMRHVVAYSQAALIGLLVPLLVLGVTAPSLATNVGVFSFVQNSKPSEFIEQFYEFPAPITVPDEKMNLVTIYVESLENTYREEELWGENLLASLDEATADWTTFENFREVRGTGWTIAGIVASQCGVLLKEENSFDLRQQLGLKSINRIGERVDEFMPGITCLGDVLDQAGYTNVFMGGADPEFAGKGKFFEDHGYDRVMGRPYWEMRGETEFTKWGLNDDKLLGYAREELDALYAAGQPFNLTVLTVDTHRPEGHISETCARRGVEDLPGVVKCTSDMIADFIGYMEQKGYLENTAVVVTGDHLTMPNVVQDIIDQEPNRTIYNRFYSPEPLTPNRDELMHFSIFPTILDMLNFSYPGDGVGLGVSAVKPLQHDRATIYDVADLDDQLRRPSELYELFWGITSSSQSD